MLMTMWPGRLQVLVGPAHLFHVGQGAGLLGTTQTKTGDWGLTLRWDWELALG